MAALRGVLLVAAFVAGCTAPLSPAAPAPVTAPPSDLHLSNCVGASLTNDYPGSTGPGGAPPGWEHTGQAGSSVYLDLYRCQRFSWGAFERGPVALVWDAHDNANFPPACLSDPKEHFDRYGLWGHLIVGDKAVARALNTTLGLPALAGDVELNDSQSALSWTWRAENGTPSHLEVLYQAASTYPYQVAHKLFWMAGGHLFSILLERTSQSVHYPLPVVTGTMAPPMLESAPSHFVSTLPRVDEGADLNGHIRSYGDARCGPSS
ncbi:MAG: hypothetical protein ACYDBQ_08875 [Thermoplasmatota archaeon]